MIPITALLVDRYGQRPLIIGGLLCFAGAGAAISLATNFAVALALRLLQGIGFAAIVPAIIATR
jgi:MFS family permease